MRRQKFRFAVIVASLLMMMLVSSAVPIVAQERADHQEATRDAKAAESDRGKALPLTQSRAELEADRLVSLSADRIVSLLVSEPGLLLECKKALVRTAFAQGRVIDPDDLTDEAVFRRVQQ